MADNRVTDDDLVELRFKVRRKLRKKLEKLAEEIGTGLPQICRRQLAISVNCPDLSTVPYKRMGRPPKALARV